MIPETLSPPVELFDMFSSQGGLPAEIAVVIPAWQPDQRLLALVSELRQMGVAHMVLVDDGSSAACQPIFSALASLDGVSMLRHAENTGKGRALKTAFRFLLHSRPGLRGVVTADADGQHLPADILAVGHRLAAGADQAVLGVRGFDGEVPLRSRAGNLITRWLFTCLTGCSVRDTQTGLRALPAALLPELLALSGERYEYETAMLVHLCQSGRAPAEHPIHTVYLDQNRSSHFHPLRDSLSIYGALLRSAWRRRGQSESAAPSRKTKEPRWHIA